jgi:hypothetical protein
MCTAPAKNAHAWRLKGASRRLQYSCERYGVLAGRRAGHGGRGEDLRGGEPSPRSAAKPRAWSPSDAPERRAGPWRPQDSEPITALALSRDGTALYTASRSLQVKRWDVETGRCVRTFKASAAAV